MYYKSYKKFCGSARSKSIISRSTNFVQQLWSRIQYIPASEIIMKIYLQLSTFRLWIKVCTRNLSTKCQETYVTTCWPLIFLSLAITGAIDFSTQFIPISLQCLQVLRMPKSNYYNDVHFTYVRLMKTHLRNIMVDHRLDRPTTMDIKHQVRVDYERIIIKWARQSQK